ncbi:MAG TPA: hypothetical protein VFQ69_08275 [Rhizomicrobium sp.]|nr:hypothetical protein [Rhizomicrobium sp.]
MLSEFNLRYLLNALRAGWATLAVFMGVSVIFTLVTLANTPATYRVQMLVLPAPSDQTQSGSTGSGALGALLGIGPGAQSGGSYIRYQRLMGSPAVAERLQQKYRLLQYIFSDRWDEERETWRPAPATLRGILLGWLFDLAHVPMSPPPDTTMLADYIAAQVQILPSQTTDVVNVSMTSRNVAFAKRIMLLAHEQTNAVLRDQVARRARQQVDYLQAKLAQTSVADYRATLLALLSAQEKTLMLTQTDASFAAEIVSPPTASATPVSPRPILSMAVAVLVGGLAGALLVIFLGPDWWRKAMAFARRARGQNGKSSKDAPR